LVHRVTKQNKTMAKETLKFESNLEKTNRDEEREKIMKEIHIPNVIGEFQYLSPEWRGDRELALFVVKRDGLALNFVSPELQDDPEVVLAAVTNAELAWNFAYPDMEAEEREELHKKIIEQVRENLEVGRREVVAELLEQEKSENPEREKGSEFIKPDNLYVIEGEKISELRNILDGLLSEKTTRPIHVYVVDDNRENINAVKSLADEYKQKGIELHDYQLKLEDPQADRTAFYNWIMQESSTNPDLILVLDFDQVIADTNGELLGPACENMLKSKLSKEKEYPKAA